jgi:hypothetical protein
MFVFANAGLDGSDDNTTVDRTECSDPYLVNAEFAHGTHETNVFGGVTPYYWPNVKSLWFAGVSKSGNINNGATPEVNFATNVISVEGYAPGTGSNTPGDNDLMYFVPVGPFSKAVNGGTSIPVDMKHACSWITINVAGDDVTANNWTLNSLVVKTLKHSGSVDCGSATASWTLTGEKTDEVYYDAGTTFTKEYVKYEKTANNFIVLPQTPTSLDVTYTYTSQEATGTTPAITLTETKNVPLTLINSLSVWSPGIHYIYNVMITATEILIDPVVVEWTEHANNPLQKEVN